MNSKFPYIFDNVIKFKEYSDEKIYNLMVSYLPDYHKKLIKKDTKEKVMSYIERNRKYLPFKNEDLSMYLAGYISRKADFSLPKERYTKSSLEEMFKGVIGLNNIKKQIVELDNFLKLRKKMDNQGIKLPDFNLHMLFLGNPGTGKTMIARIVAKVLFDLGYIKDNKCIEVSAKDLIGEYIGQTALKTSRVINSAMGGVLFIDEAYSISQGRGNFGKESIAVIVKAMEDYKGDLVIIFAGYSKEMQEFIRVNSGLRSRIGYTFEFADYSEDELYEIFKLKSSKINLKISKEAEKSIKELINYGKSRTNFGNGRYIDNILQKVLTKHAKLNFEGKDALTLVKNSIPTIDEITSQSSGERHPDEIQELFSDVIGMDNIKKQVFELKDYIVFRDKISKLSDTTLPEMRLHMLFLGDAGTGKTLIARKVTQVLYDIGCIRINKLVEVERKDLVAEFVGQTAPKTEKVIESALGGVLFIDEAYSLAPYDNATDFGQEAIATLIKAMEDYRDEFVVIFAGYKKEMKRFINSNSGIASRIGYTFNFENYSDADLYKIFETKCKKYNLEITNNVKKKVMEVLKFFSSVENFGNGRFVDKLLQQMLVKHAKNPKLDENVNILLKEDVPTVKEMVDITFNNIDNLTIPSDITTQERKRIAVHELGHAIINYLYFGESNLKLITVVPEGNGTLGHVLHSDSREKVLYTKSDYIKKIESLLAGRAAEEIFFGIEGVSTGCWNDLEKVANIIDDIFNECGLSQTLGLLSTRNISANVEMKDKLDEEKKKTIDEAYEHVKIVLTENLPLFDNVLNYLMEKGTLTGDEFEKLINKKAEA